MPKAQLKSHETNASVLDFLNNVQDEDQKKDAQAINKLMQEVTKEQPKMWGDSIIGYGNVHLKYPSGRELDWFKVGFSPRKGKISLYICNGGLEDYKNLLDEFGKHEQGKGCIYIKKLSDINTDVLKKIIKKSIN